MTNNMLQHTIAAGRVGRRDLAVLASNNLRIVPLSKT
jgi:hypothetical protein